jgi:hypothetical protein
MLHKIKHALKEIRTRPLEINIKPRAWRKSAQKFLTSTPVKINDKPIQLWKVLLPLTLLILIPLLTFVVKQVNQPPTPEEIAAAEYQKARNQADTLSKTVGEQTEVPTDETPNVATVTDVTQLQDQPFFKLAQNGDKLLIYEKKKIIVLYRPGEKKVIATAPVLYNQPETAVAGTESATMISSPSAN